MDLAGKYIKVSGDWNEFVKEHKELFDGYKWTSGEDILDFIPITYYDSAYIYFHDGNKITINDGKYGAILEDYTELDLNDFEENADSEKTKQSFTPEYSVVTINDGYYASEIGKELVSSAKRIGKPISKNEIVEQSQYDDVTQPQHYMLENGMQVKDIIRYALGDEKYIGWSQGNVIKYTLRYADKGTPVKDLKKAQQNLQMIIDVLEEEDNE
ncbi:nucleotide kinase [Weissella phage WCP30]|uniref:nucleotide kinase n=1 Tax=Weissella phage WCP30 TaxID=1837862 RepID=UPI0008110420|nr:nucleotide kinase [Weissella phage WCP30]ANU78878.1 hypothetical protein [Weissella phage WCP30]